MADVRVGISGWRYAPWRGAFYPRDLPQRLELWYASRRLSAIEINGSFYSLQRPESYAEWYAQTPVGFLFAIKGPRFITHMKKLREVETPLANFFASGVFNLRSIAGPTVSVLGVVARSSKTRGEPPRRTRRARNHAMCFAFSTIPT